MPTVQWCVKRLPLVLIHAIAAACTDLGYDAILYIAFQSHAVVTIIPFHLREVPHIIIIYIPHIQTQSPFSLRVHTLYIRVSRDMRLHPGQPNDTFFRCSSKISRVLFASDKPQVYEPISESKTGTRGPVTLDYLEGPTIFLVEPFFGRNVQMRLATYVFDATAFGCHCKVK